MCGVVRARDNNAGGGGQMAYKMVVAGGLYKNGYTDAVEIYDMRRNTWTMGKLVLGRWEAFISAFRVLSNNVQYQYAVFINPYCLWCLKLAISESNIRCH